MAARPVRAAMGPCVRSTNAERRPMCGPPRPAIMDADRSCRADVGACLQVQDTRDRRRAGPVRAREVVTGSASNRPADLTKT